VEWTPGVCSGSISGSLRPTPLTAVVGQNEAMKPPALFYTLLLTLAWIACAVLAALFPGNEHLNQVPVCAPGYLFLRCLPWTRNLSYGSISQFTVPAGVGVVMVFILAVGMDWLRVRRVVWRRAVLAVAICCVTFWLYGFVHDTRLRLGESFASTAHHWRLNEPDRLIAYPLSCLSSGLLLGSIVAFIYGGIERILKAANKGGPANRSQPVRSETNATSPAAGSGR
jgi:hypothetical protein